MTTWSTVYRLEQQTIRFAGIAIVFAEASIAWTRALDPCPGRTKGRLRELSRMLTG